MRINIDIINGFFDFSILTGEMGVYISPVFLLTFVLNLMGCCVLGIAWPFRGCTCYAFCSWISWFLQCSRGKIYPHYNGSHPFPCLGCKLNFNSLRFFLGGLCMSLRVDLFS